MRSAQLLPTLLAAALLGACPPVDEPDPPDITTTLGTFARPDGGPPPENDGGPAALCAGVDCSALDDVCVRGVCDPETGACGAEALPDGFACVDDDPCTHGDSCLGGACTGEPVVCAAPPCHVASCSATGACVVSALPDGAACDDGSACTTDDTCQAGACAGAPVTCSDLDDVCVFGVCDPALGCVSAPLGDGTPCSDADACTIPDVCIGGACVNDPLDCATAAGPCEVGTCDALSGACLFAPVDPGAACDDGDSCTLSDACDDTGVCRGEALSCPVAGPCEVPVCDEATGACGVMAVPDGTGCDDEDPCTIADVCAGGACAGTPRDCASLAGPCQDGTCDGATGDCQLTPANEGGPCDDDATDCLDATCAGGSCVTAPRGDCAACGVQGELVCTNDVCGPAVPVLVEGFEAGVLPASMTTAGDAPWTPLLGSSASGAYSLRSGAIADGETTSVIFEASCGVTSQLSFMLAGETEEGLDVLSLLVDDVVVATWSGSLAWQQARYPAHPFLPPFAVPTGHHRFELRYEKGGSGSVGLDAVFIDDLRLTDVTAPQDFEAGEFVGGSFGPLVADGDGTWSVDATTAAFGTSSARLTGLEAGQSGALVWSFTLSRAHALSGFARADARPGEGLRVLIDGFEAATVFGATGWLAFPQQVMNAGPHEVRFEFSNANGAATHSVWVDHLALSPATCP